MQRWEDEWVTGIDPPWFGDIIAMSGTHAANLAMSRRSSQSHGAKGSYGPAIRNFCKELVRFPAARARPRERDAGDAGGPPVHATELPVEPRETRIRVFRRRGRIRRKRPRTRDFRGTPGAARAELPVEPAARAGCSARMRRAWRPR